MSQMPATKTSPENYRLLQQSVYAQVGIVLEDDKHYLFESRLTPVVRDFGLRSINELCGLLQSGKNPDLGYAVAEAMTTNETYFFREPAHYELIRTTLLKKLREEYRDTRKLSFWSAASSTGQEAYSLAMLLNDEGLQGWNLQILGTDFSSTVVERARLGLYQEVEVNRGLTPNLVAKHFRRHGKEWQLSEAIRRMVRFETIDLRKGITRLGPFHLVFCRNVMIYFDSKTKLNILREIHRTMFRGGWLLLGGAESSFELDEIFERVRMGSTTIYVAK